MTTRGDQQPSKIGQSMQVKAISCYLVLCCSLTYIPVAKANGSLCNRFNFNSTESSHVPDDNHSLLSGPAWINTATIQKDLNMAIGVPLEGVLECLGGGMCPNPPP